jgi:hypothetical protein
MSLDADAFQHPAAERPRARRRSTSRRHRMNIRAATLGLAVICSCAIFQAHAQPFTSDEQVGQWMTYYYRAPDPGRIADAVRYMSQAGLLKKVPPPVIGFIAGTLGAQPQSAMALVNQLTFLPEDDQPVLVLGVWYSGLVDAKPMLQELLSWMPRQKAHIDHLLKNTPPRIVDLPPEQGAWVLDVLWGNFMATGGEEPIKRIIGVLPWSEVRGDIPRLLVGGAARWSLTSNAVQHDRVFEICKLQTSAQNPQVGAILNEVIRNAEAERASKK